MRRSIPARNAEVRDRGAKAGDSPAKFVSIRGFRSLKKTLKKVKKKLASP
jgi:hypothetical protein